MTEDLEYNYYPLIFAKTKIFPGATSGEVVKILDLSYHFIVSIREEIVKSYWMNTYEYILKESIWKTKSVLSFGDFYKFSWIRNNIHCFFYDNYIWEIYRSQSFYKKFATENPDLDQKLKEIFNNKTHFHKLSRVHVRLLYRAYQIMISYDEVKTNNNLFS